MTFRKKNNYQKGMTYVELIVVLSIFAIMSSIVIFNYQDFQEKVDMKNLTSDIALRIVEAQKSAMSGKLPSTGAPSDTWKPSYGVYFNLSDSNDTDGIPFNKKFTYFVNLYYSASPYFFYEGYDSGSDGILDTSLIPKEYFISDIYIMYNDDVDEDLKSSEGDNLSIIFTRPSSGAKFFTTTGDGTESELSNINYVRITIKSSGGKESQIDIYPSGRIQVN